MNDILSSLHSKNFTEHLHTIFSARVAEDASVPLKLIEVAEKPTPPNIELFILHFLGPVSPRLAQKTYLLEHPQIGSFQLFLTVIGADHEGTQYEAVFHRLLKS